MKEELTAWIDKHPLVQQEVIDLTVAGEEDLLSALAAKKGLSAAALERVRKVLSEADPADGETGGEAAA